MFIAYSGASNSIAESASGTSKASQPAKKRRKKAAKAAKAKAKARMMMADVARVEARDALPWQQPGGALPWQLGLTRNERAEMMAALFGQIRSHDASVPPGAFHQQEMEWVWTPGYEGYFYAEVPASEDGGGWNEEVLGDHVRL